MNDLSLDVYENSEKLQIAINVWKEEGVDKARRYEWVRKWNKNRRSDSYFEFIVSCIAFFGNYKNGLGKELKCQSKEVDGCRESLGN